MVAFEDRDAAFRKTPNTPEQVELVQSDVRDLGRSVEFKFRFARSMTNEDVMHQWHNNESALFKIVVAKLAEKKWFTPDGQTTLAPVTTDTTQSDPKTWVFRFKRHAE